MSHEFLSDFLGVAALVLTTIITLWLPAILAARDSGCPRFWLPAILAA